jgi:hypothetical protein
MAVSSARQLFERPPARAGDADATAGAAGKPLHRLSRLAFLLDDRFRIPGTNVRFGWDSIMGLVPGVGDAAGAALSAYIVLEGRRLGVPKRLITKMVGNIAIDAAVGVIPIVGDLADIGWKANRKNVHIVMDHLDRQARPRPAGED